MAQYDLTHGKNRYNLYSSEKSYLNVLVLRSTSTSVIFKAGDEIIFYDRANIKRLERFAPQQDDFKGIK